MFIANDWHTALLPVYLKAYYRDNGFMPYARSVLVIHNIAHQVRSFFVTVRIITLSYYMDLTCFTYLLLLSSSLVHLVGFIGSLPPTCLRLRDFAIVVVKIM